MDEDLRFRVWHRPIANGDEFYVNVPGIHTAMSIILVLRSYDQFLGDIRVGGDFVSESGLQVKTPDTNIWLEWSHDKLGDIHSYMASYFGDGDAS